MSFGSCAHPPSNSKADAMVPSKGSILAKVKRAHEKHTSLNLHMGDVPVSHAKFCELGVMPAAGAAIQRNWAGFQGKSPIPPVESAPGRSKAGRTYAYAQVASLAGLTQGNTASHPSGVTVCCRVRRSTVAPRRIVPRNSLTGAQLGQNCTCTLRNKQFRVLIHRFPL